MYKKLEKPRCFLWHQDNGYKFIEPQVYLTCWIAITDATEDNGCLYVAPRFYCFGTLEHTYVELLGWECFSEPPSLVPALVGAGGIVVFSSLTFYFIVLNVTSEVCKAYIVQYAPVGVRAFDGDFIATSMSYVSQDHFGHQFFVLRGGVFV